MLMRLLYMNFVVVVAGTVGQSSVIYYAIYEV